VVLLYALEVGEVTFAWTLAFQFTIPSVLLSRKCLFYFVMYWTYITTCHYAGFVSAFQANTNLIKCFRAVSSVYVNSSLLMVAPGCNCPLFETGNTTGFRYSCKQKSGEGRAIDSRDGN